MAATTTARRTSNQSAKGSTKSKNTMANQRVVVRSESPATPQRSPIRKRKGVTLQQKQALIDNLQLEITERARRLRAQYHLQAQGLRSRIEIRINRIPQSLRKAKMGDLLLKYAEQEEKRSARPPVPAKDQTRPGPARHARNAASPMRPAQKRMSEAISGDKENDFELVDNAKKKARGAPATDLSSVRSAQILSPTSSNSRLTNRDRPPSSPTKTLSTRPVSPVKQSQSSRSGAAASVLSSMVEKAKATRAGVTKKAPAASSTTSSAAGTVRGRKAAPAASRAPTSRPGTRTGRRASGNSESSEASTGTVVKKSTATKAATTTTKKSVMSSIRKGVTGGTTKKTATTKGSAPASTSSTGRVLRKRA